MKMNPIFRAFVFPALLLAQSTSCKKEIRVENADKNLSAASSKAVAQHAEAALLKSVRNATAKFHSTAKAIQAGYEPSDHCVAVPTLGGMGYHWVNPLLVDQVFDPLKPEALLYAKGPGGNLRLVAVEYIVIDLGQQAPMFGNQPFDEGGTPVPAPHWSLHAWIFENNPSGMFMPFNPNISCP